MEKEKKKRLEPLENASKTYLVLPLAYMKGYCLCMNNCRWAWAVAKRSFKKETGKGREPKKKRMYVVSHIKSTWEEKKDECKRKLFLLGKGIIS